MHVHNPPPPSARFWEKRRQESRKTRKTRSVRRRESRAAQGCVCTVRRSIGVRGDCVPFRTLESRLFHRPRLHPLPMTRIPSACRLGQTTPVRVRPAVARVVARFPS
jgi:hypothetical protein